LYAVSAHSAYTIFQSCLGAPLEFSAAFCGEKYMLKLTTEAPSVPDAPEAATVASPSDATSKPLVTRLLSLDVFRGLTIAAMVLVNNQGNWSAVYPPLKHAQWDGWTPTDLIFPYFVFIVGVAIPLAFEKRVAAGGSQRDLYWKIFKRSVLIFAIGMIVLQGFPYTLEKFSHIRIPGVLQRIALCYLCASLIYITTKTRLQALIAGALLLGYWLVMKTIPAPGYAAGDLSVEGNLASWIDRTLLAGHIYRPLYDPEGLLSTIPAISTCLAGVLTGTWLQTRREPLDKAAGMFGVGAICVMVGYLWHQVFPINKALWTSSYVVFTAGMALQLLALCYWAIDIKGWTRWTKPFVIFGVNALALFVLSGLMARVISMIPMAKPDGSPGNLQQFIYERLLSSWLSPINASLGYALLYLFFWLGVLTILYRRRIFIKV
jgi:predicted acyltransferase